MGHDWLQRFGIEGCEALLPGMRAMAYTCAQHGAQHLLVGMPHRGRLNVLCTLLQKPPGALFAQMNNAQSQYHVGDVKYHLGQGADLTFASEASARPESSSSSRTSALCCVAEANGMLRCGVQQPRCSTSACWDALMSGKRGAVRCKCICALTDAQAGFLKGLCADRELTFARRLHQT